MMFSSLDMKTFLISTVDEKTEATMVGPKKNEEGFDYAEEQYYDLDYQTNTAPVCNGMYI